MRQAKSITIRADEARAYEQLCEWADRTDAARFILAVLNTRPAVTGPEPQLWRVPSSSGKGDYLVDLEARACTCDGFHFKHHCSHLAVADRAARLHYELTTSPAMPVAIEGNHHAEHCHH